MAKLLAKYFVALVPVGEIQEDATRLKQLLKSEFNLAYALKSPAHITIKMPFNWNEAKEDKLIELLGNFCNYQKAFEISLNGFGRFRQRVIYIDVTYSENLQILQKSLTSFAKTTLKQPLELSDRAFHPHMTLAFKDIKVSKFEEYWRFIKQQSFLHTYPVSHISLLKRIEGRWKVIRNFSLVSTNKLNGDE